MVKIVLREEYLKKDQEEKPKPRCEKMKSAINAANTVLSALDVVSDNKAIRLARLMKEVIDIFSKH